MCAVYTTGVDDKKKVIVVKVEKEEPKKDAKVVYLVDKKP